MTINKDVTIYGNGHTIKRADNYTGTLITVTAGELELDNVTLDGGAVWSTGDNVTPANRKNQTDQGGVQAIASDDKVGQLLVVTGGSVDLKNYTTLQNNDRFTDSDPIGDEGSAIYVNGGNLTMDSTTVIQNNTVKGSSQVDSCGDGAAVAVEGNSTVTISGKITGNYAERMGGAVRVFQATTANVTLKDITITENYSLIPGSGTPFAAVVIGGTYNENGSGNAPTVSLSGKVVIKDNYTTGGILANLSANNGGRLVNAGLSQGSEIGVYSTGFGENATVMTNAEATDVAYFKHDTAGLIIASDESSKEVKVAKAAASVTIDGVTTSYATMDGALKALPTDGKEATITMHKDVTGAIEIPEGTIVTLDLNGYTINGTVTNKGDLTIEDSSESKDGTITGSHGVINLNVLTVNDGIIEGTSFDGISNGSNDLTDTTNKKDTIKITINGGTIKGKNYAICDYAVNSINTVTGGTLENAGSDYVIGSYGQNNGGTWTIASGVTMKGQPNLMVNTGENGEATVAPMVTLVNANRIEYVNNNDGTYTVNVKSYDEYSLNDELEDIAKSGAVAHIALIDNVTGPITVPADAKVVLDLNGYEITGGINNYGDLTIEDSKGDGKIISANPGIGVCNFNKLTVNAGTIEGMGYEGISNMNTAVSLDINGGTVSGGGYAVCDYGVNSINTVTGGTLISKARGVGSGIGYVIGSYGSSKGGTWVITSGVAMENKNGNYWVNTDENGQASGAAQVALANKGAVNLDNVTGDAENGYAMTVSGEGSLENNITKAVEVQVKALKDAINASLTDPEKTEMLNKVDAMAAKVNAEITAANGDVADLTLAASKLAAASDVLAKALEAYEAIAEMTDDTRKAELKAEVKTAVNTALNDSNGTIWDANTTDKVVTAKTDAITAIELALVEAKADAAQNLTSGDKAEIDAALDAVEAGTDSADQGVAKVENILNKADMVSEINAMSGLTPADKAKLVDVAETAKETSATNIGTAADANAVALAAAKAEANYEAIAAVADAYAYINSQNLSTAAKNAAKAALDAALAAAQRSEEEPVGINNANNVAEIGHALQTLMDEIDRIKADNTRGWSSSGGGFSGVYNYQVTAPQVDNCNVTVSDSSAVAGETVTVTTKPDGGYGVSEVIVTDKNGNEIEVTALGNGQFTFVMPAGGVDVSVVCKPAITMVIDSLYINIFGKIVKNDVAPKIVDGRTVLPIRVVAEALGADVDWDPTAQKVTITKGDTVIELFIGKYIAFVDGEPVQLDVAPFIDNNRTYLPVRFVSEYLGAIVNWDAETRTVTIVPGE